jgi:hypothetical protein
MIFKFGLNVSGIETIEKEDDTSHQQNIDWRIFRNHDSPK